MVLPRFCFIALGLWTSALLAVDPEVPKSTSADFRVLVDSPFPNLTLPKHVKADPGVVTLFADFEHPAAEGVPLYIVNRSDKSLDLGTQDGSLKIKLDYLDTEGDWKLAQSHRSSWCGNSYGSRVLNPGQHFRSFGYRVKSGTKGRVRYSLYERNKLVSNVGDGYVLTEDIAADERTGLDASLLAFLMTRDISFNEQTSKAAYVNVGQAAEALSVLGGVAYAKNQVSLWVQFLDGKKTPNEMEVRLKSSLKEALERWPARENEGRLFEYCFRIVTGEKKAVWVGEDYAWTLLADMVRTYGLSGMPSQEIPLSSYKAVWELAAKKIGQSDPNLHQSLLSLLQLNGAVDEWLPDSLFEPLIRHESLDVVSMAAATLARRGRFEWLAEQGSKLEADHQDIILKHLAVGYGAQPVGSDGAGGLRGPKEMIEMEFWIHCIESRPFKALSIFTQLPEMGYGCKKEVWPVLRRGIWSYWRERASQMKETETEFKMSEAEAEAARMMLSLVTKHRTNANARNLIPFEKDDIAIPILEKLTRHRGYTSPGSSGSFQEARDNQPKYFLVQEFAKRMLSRLQDRDLLPFEFLD